MNKLDIASLNVWGLRDYKERQEMFTWLKSKQCHILFLQETHCTHEVEEAWKNEWGHEIIFSNRNNHGGGVCILFTDTIDYKIENIIRDDNGGFLILELTVNNVRLALCNVYAPNQDEPLFFSSVFEKLETFADAELIMGGDFNLVQDVSMDKTGGRPVTNSKSQTIVKQKMSECDLIDVWRIFNPEFKRYTWRRRKPEIKCRLDYFLTSSSIVNKTEKTCIYPGFRTDHSLITISIQLHNEKRGPGFWKLNVSLLLDKEYVSKIRKVITDSYNLYKSQGTAPDMIWEVIKSDIRGETIKFSSFRKKQRVNRLKTLENELQELQIKNDINNDQNLVKDIEHLENEIRDLISYEYKGAAVRAKVQWLSEGEKTSKFFMNLEKVKYKSKVITMLNEDDTLITDQNYILNAQKSFYENLYTTCHPVSDETRDYDDFFPGEKKSNAMSDECRDLLEKEIMLDEIKSTIKSMKNNKTPGVDGLPVEFYKIFWNDIHDILLDSYNHSISLRYLSISQRRGVISLIPKTDKDPHFLKNWRPITLLSTDYKILSSLIATRIK